jgi:hypothetical protein
MARLLDELDRDLVKALTGPDAGRTVGITEATEDRGREPHDPAEHDAAGLAERPRSRKGTGRPTPGEVLTSPDLPASQGSTRS